MLVGISSEIERIKEEIAKRKSGLEFFKLNIDIHQSKLYSEISPSYYY